MANSKKLGGLGRGLDAIFMDNAIEEETASKAPLMMKLSDIEPKPGQPRKKFDEEALASLAQSIKENGLIQPIVVRDVGNGFYRIIAGERRWRACKIAGLTEAPVRIMTLTDRQADELTLIENLQREDLTPLEEAQGYKSLMSEYGITQQQLSETIGKSRPAVANALRLLELPEDTAKLVNDGVLSAGHARALLGLGDKSKINELSELIAEKELNVRQTEELVKKYNKNPPKQQVEENSEADGEIKVDYTAELERSLTMSLGRMVKINDRTSSKGKKPSSITIEYTDNEDLENIIALLVPKTEQSI